MTFKGIGGRKLNEIRVNTYTIGYQTKAIFPTPDPFYPTKVLEKDRWVFVSQRVMRIIYQSCLHGGASYDGRKDAVLKAKEHMTRVPIPVLVKQQVCVIPMMEPSDLECVWICSHHYKKVQAIKEKWGQREEVTRVILTDGLFIDLAQSKPYVEKQMKRGIEISKLFTEY